jgi:HK97 gp10 family phage protein
MADEMVGLKELGSAMTQFSQKVEKKLVRHAVNAGAEVFRREIRAKAPVRVEVGQTGFRNTAKGKEQREPGYLKKHIGRQIKVSDSAYTVEIGPTKSAYYGAFDELGTKHQPARPFMRPAFDSKQVEAERVFAETMQVDIDKELK